MSKRNPFDFVKSVSYDKKDIMVDDIEEKATALQPASLAEMSFDDLEIISNDTDQNITKKVENKVICYL